MRITSTKIIQPFKHETVERPWGFYGLYSDNEPCTSKILYIQPQETLSLQVHFKRDQFYLILDGPFLIHYSTKPIPQEIIENPNEPQRFKDTEDFLVAHLVSETANEDDMFGFHKLVVHRAQYLGNKKYGRILDIAFGHNDETDIVRLQDKYYR